MNSIKIKENKENKHNLFICLFFLLLSIPFINVTSILNGAVIVGFITCFFLILEKKYTFDKYILIVSVLFIIGELLSLIKCPNISRSIIFSIQKIIILFVLYPVMKSVIKNEKDKVYASNKYKLGCLISSVIIILSSVLKINVGFIKYAFKAQRLVLAGFGPNVIARLLCIGALFAFYDSQISKGRKKMNNYIIFLLISFALLTTVSMSGVILLGIGCLIILLCANQNVKKFGIIKVVFIILIAIICITFLYNHSPNMKYQLDKFIQRFDDTSVDRTNGRLEGLTNFWSNFNKYYLLGIGYGCSNYINGGTIHFPIIASLLETGIVGFLSCSLLYFYPLLIDIMTLKKRFNIYSFISVLIIVGDMIQPNPNYVFTWFAIFLGCISVSGGENINDKKDI